MTFHCCGKHQSTLVHNTASLFGKTTRSTCYFFTCWVPFLFFIFFSSVRVQVEEDTLTETRDGGITLDGQLIFADVGELVAFYMVYDEKVLLVGLFIIFVLLFFFLGQVFVGCPSLLSLLCFLCSGPPAIASRHHRLQSCRHACTRLGCHIACSCSHHSLCCRFHVAIRSTIIFHALYRHAHITWTAVARSTLFVQSPSPPKSKRCGYCARIHPVARTHAHTMDAQTRARTTASF